MLPSIYEYPVTFDPASIVEFEILHPGPTEQLAPITTFGPITALASTVTGYSYMDGSILGWKSSVGKWCRVTKLCVIAEDV
jgi:hypothetical protein